MIAACLPRSRSALVAIISNINPRSEKYLPKDGLTHCNSFARDVSDAMGIMLPQALANDQLVWLSSPAASDCGWRQCTAVEATVAAELGELAVAGEMNPEGHGHIAIVVPSTGGSIYVAQAGLRCFASEPIANGFGHHSPSFWRHP